MPEPLKTPPTLAPVLGCSLLPAGHIPWELHVLAWEQYHKHFPSQSAERIAERGGFSWTELIALLQHRDFFEGTILIEAEVRRIRKEQE